MNRLMLILLALAVPPAFAQPTYLEPIHEIKDEFLTGYWDEHSLESMQATTKSRLATIAENAPKQPVNICKELQEQISAEAFSACSAARSSNSAIARASNYIRAASLSDNQKLANYAVTEARKSMSEALVVKMVNEVLR